MVSFANFTGIHNVMINTGGFDVDACFGDIVFIMSHQYALLCGFWGNILLCKKGTRARNNNESATKSSSEESIKA
jgi:hypothetical protein